MSTEVYTFEDRDGAEQSFSTEDINEARKYARANALRLIANTYELSDSEMIEDHTPPRRLRRVRITVKRRAAG